MTRPFPTADQHARDIVTGRRSIRRFLPDAVPMETVRQILTDAARAPSGTNTQPWKVTCVTGDTRDRVSQAVLAAAEAGDYSEEYAYMPKDMGDDYLARKRALGYELYSLYGIDRKDYPARKAAMLRNFEFFGAPVGLFFAMDRHLLYGSWLDCGMFIQNVMLLARTHGLETCCQQAWAEFGRPLREELGIPDNQLILCGMALGHPDPEAPENTLVSAREDLETFARFLD